MGVEIRNDIAILSPALKNPKKYSGHFTPDIVAYGRQKPACSNPL
jgi:hypothetical protein